MKLSSADASSVRKPGNDSVSGNMDDSAGSFKGSQVPRPRSTPIPIANPVVVLVFSGDDETVSIVSSAPSSAISSTDVVGTSAALDAEALGCWLSLPSRRSRFFSPESG